MKKIIIREWPVRSERIVVGAHEQFIYVFFLDQKGDQDCDLTFELGGEGASVRVFGFTIGAEGSSRVALRVMHQGKHTEGFAWMKSLLGGRARCSVKGMIKIGKNAPHANAFFTHKSLLLSAAAKVTTSPSLEIENNEVKASHAATIGHFDNNVIFYLLSRGIGGEEAKKLVMTSFAGEYLNEIPDEETRKKVGMLLQERIEKFA